MKILRTMGILALVAGLVLGGTSSAFAQGGPPGKRHGFFGTVDSASVDVVTLTTTKVDEDEWTVTVTLTATTKYMIPRVTRGPVVGLAAFEAALGEPITTIVDRRVAVLATNVVEDPPGYFTADAIRLMLIPSSDSPPLHRHRVGVVQAFSEGTSITIIDEDEVTHTFALLNGTVYRPNEIAGLTGTDLENALAGGFVTVVIKGDPKLPDPIAKAIVLHKPEE